MVPTRGRRARCERLLESFTATAGPDTDLLFITDADDQETYAGMDWGRASSAVLEPRDYLTGKLNKTAMAMADTYDVLAWLADDCVPETPGWDKLMLATLKDELGGSGWVYPDDKRRSDVPEHWMVSSDVVKTLGWFAPPHVQHFYCDNIVGELGKRAGLIRWCPEAVIRHEHYSVARDVEHDEVYQSAEEMFGASDLAAFQEWRSSQAANEVSLLRRAFSADVAWVLSKVS